MAASSGLASAQLVASANFGPIYNTGQQVTFADYNPSANGNVPLTSMYVYLTSYVSGTGVFIGNGGTPVITVSDNVSLSNVPTLSEVVSATYTSSGGALANNATRPFSFTGSSATVFEIVTQNLANYSGGGNFTINVSSSLNNVNVTGGSYDQNASTFPASGTVTVSFNGPLPVPESSAWAWLAPLLLLIPLRRRLGRMLVRASITA